MRRISVTTEEIKRFMELAFLKVGLSETDSKICARLSVKSTAGSGRRQGYSDCAGGRGWGFPAEIFGKPGYHQCGSR